MGKAKIFARRQRRRSDHNSLIFFLETDELKTINTHKREFEFMKSEICISGTDKIRKSPSLHSKRADRKINMGKL